MAVGLEAGGAQHPVEQRAMVEADGEIRESQCGQRLAGGSAELGLDQQRRRADGVDVALVELAEPAARGAIGAPHRLDLVALEELRQRRAVLGHHARERHGQVVAQRQVGLARGGVLAALEDLEDELIALVAVLAEQRLDVLDSRRLERLEAVALVDALDDVDDEGAAAEVGRQEVAHPARGLGRRHERLGTSFWFVEVVEAVAHVAGGVVADGRHFLVPQRSLHRGGAAHHERPGGNTGTFDHEGAGGDDAILFDRRPR